MLKQIAYAALAVLMLARLAAPADAGVAGFDVGHATPYREVALGYSAVRTPHAPRPTRVLGERFAQSGFPSNRFPRVRRGPARGRSFPPRRGRPFFPPRGRSYRPSRGRPYRPPRANPYRPDRPGNYRNIIPPSRAIGVARRRAGGKLLGLRRGRRFGRPVYVIKFRDDYSVREVIIDARSGRILN